MGADIGGKSAVGLDCKLSCGIPVSEEYDPSLSGRVGTGLG